MDTASTAALAALKEAHSAKSDPLAAEVKLIEALRLDPDNFDVRLGAYRFYFFNHRYGDALPHAEFILAHAARRLNIPVDWRNVSVEDADFTQKEFVPGIYLQALLALGYCKVRLGELAVGSDAVAKVAEIDPSDRFGAKPILELIERAGEDADAEESD
jgi:hypothetical protein